MLLLLPLLLLLLLHVAGWDFGEPEDVEYVGVPLSLGPRVVMLTSFATSTQDLRRKAGPGVKVSSRRSDLYVNSYLCWKEVLLLVCLFLSCLLCFLLFCSDFKKRNDEDRWMIDE